MEKTFPTLCRGSFSKVKNRLDHLGAEPPQVLLLEGGTENERLELAHYWACLCNCPHSRESGQPCCRCSVCHQIVEQEYLDCLEYDGRISRKQEEEAPGPVRALTMENVRALKSLLQDSVSGRYRVIILSEIQRSETANAFLKVLENPSPTNLFVLLTSQREQILPTLVSRSLCLTLPWALSKENATSELIQAYEEFLFSGKALFSFTGEKSFSIDNAEEILLHTQHAIISLLTEEESSSRIKEALAPLEREDVLQVSRWMSEARNNINFVTPGRVMEAFCSTLFLLRSHRVRANSAKVSS